MPTVTVKEAEPVTPPPPTVVVELSMDEASMLKAVLGVIGGSGSPDSQLQMIGTRSSPLLNISRQGEYDKGPRGAVIDPLYHALATVKGIDRG